MRRLCLSLLILLATASPAWAASMTTSNDGNWSSTTVGHPWTALTGAGPGGVPLLIPMRTVPTRRKAG